jgi:hypothetical protein
MANQTPTTETVTVKNNLSTVSDSQRAADLFARILRAVREQAEEEREQKGEHKPAA